MNDYEMTIGIECHVQLATKTKLFSPADNDARDAAPNSKTHPIDFGLPGMLPILNWRAIELAARAGKALGAEIAHESRFDRKHYFYPDLPKGYQTSQMYQPIILIKYSTQLEEIAYGKKSSEIADAANCAVVRRDRSEPWDVDSVFEVGRVFESSRCLSAAIGMSEDLAPGFAEAPPLECCRYFCTHDGLALVFFFGTEESILEIISNLDDRESDLTSN